MAEITHLEESIAELQKALADKEQEVNQVKTELEQERGQNTKLTTENAGVACL